MGGFFGVVSKKPCINDLFYGTDYNSHLGTKRAGIATYSSEYGFERSIHNIESDYFRSKFEEELDDFHGNSGIGVISDHDSQPIIIHSHLGRYAVVTVGKLDNQKELEEELLAEGKHFTNSASTNTSEIISILISTGKTFAEGIRIVHTKVKGSCSMLLLTDHGIIAARDRWGRTPVVLAQKGGAYAVTSESCSLPNLDYETIRELGPGEAVMLTENGIEALLPPMEGMQICSFLWVYYGFPNSCYEGRNVEDVRYSCGVEMAKNETCHIDSICGIPDSGVGVALGYADTMNVPYRRAITKYTPTWPRSFTPSNQERRSLVAKMKLIPNATILRDKKLLFCDDSIVRGTQLRDNVKILFDKGVKEVHVRISCPPLIYPCPFIRFTSSRSVMELITRRIIKEKEGDENKNLKAYTTTDTPEYKAMVEEIRKQLKLTSLRFNSVESLVKAIGLPKCRLCTHCFDGSSHF